MPKLLQKSLWKWTLDVATFAIFMAITWFSVDWFVGISAAHELFSSLAGAMCIPYALLIANSVSFPAANEYIYIAPFSCGQRKNLLRTYFWHQCLHGCILSLLWSIFVGYIISGRPEITLHPGKLAFMVMMQFCMIFELLFINYYRPHMLLLVVVLILLLIGDAIPLALLNSPAMSVSDYIVMIILGSFHAATVLVIRMKYFDKMLDCHSRYETSRNIPRGFR